MNTIIVNIAVETDLKTFLQCLEECFNQNGEIGSVKINKVTFNFGDLKNAEKFRRYLIDTNVVEMTCDEIPQAIIYVR